MIQVVETTVGPDGTVKTRSAEFALSPTRAMSAPIPDDGYSTGDLVPYSWAPGGYFCRACPDCGEGYSGDKRCRRCRACAVKALEAERAKPPAPPQAGPEPTDAQVEAFGDAFFGELTQWGYSERQRNGIADGVRRGLRAALAIGVSGNPAPAEAAAPPSRTRDAALPRVGSFHG
ncbi:hypothetical protein [Methylorubrum extorquens]|uniref:hypothetical protein n=1 Tax=Methylorubrum extorquens TaxID=408 RepID=UPI0011BF2433|nr:hypothetical protein [Methylorubrum extorquens]